MKLFCFPYAGGSAYTYRGLEAHLPPHIQLIPVELPGRGRLAGKPLLKSLPALVDYVFNELRDELRGAYALFGHSMGASVAYELTRRIAVEGSSAPPRHLFVSGRQAPSVPNKHRRWDLPDQAFRDTLRELGGCPTEVLESEEFMEFFEPVLRADFAVVENHLWTPSAPLDVPVSILIGDEDDVTLEEAERWQETTLQGAVIFRFRGNHFFLLEYWQEIADLIALRLTGTDGTENLIGDQTHPQGIRATSLTYEQ